MQAVIIGATGATGQELVQQLLDNPDYSQVTVFVRRAVPLQHPKLTVEVIDFDRPQTWQHKVRGDVLFSCLGTTLKAAGSKAAQWKIDYQYQYDVANIARQNGVPRCVLVSSGYANSRSRFFYTRMKGQLEQDITQLGFPQLLIFRPPSLIRPNTDRAGERWAIRVLNGLNKIGLLQGMKPMPTAVLASALIQAVKQKPLGTFILESAEIWELAK
ncbi:NAD(P)H-binding protein [Bisgaard Taxon 10/6]|uniref:NAD(P)H-binding protein n=1 Tax=Exercitatus varius TaxID=67857 RepID=A0AAW6QBI4_9PAST|nr:NAD(P)H-binding protein [Exercitatus varius]MDG2917938.1 NAD(P)H-binding protein [Exercitatus varius]MDG2947978.1 NAD(P)H-binding protein [Exercitatus varius]MDG2949470.1 NAD(P)H-binding protein [Exercitatus varius]MDG2960013.1 NAD(P)H-binding protein [Exercitatus varius]